MARSASPDFSVPKSSLWFWGAYTLRAPCTQASHIAHACTQPHVHTYSTVSGLQNPVCGAGKHLLETRGSWAVEILDVRGGDDDFVLFDMAQARRGGMPKSTVGLYTTTKALGTSAAGGGAFIGSVVCRMSWWCQAYYCVEAHVLIVAVHQPY